MTEKQQIGFVSVDQRDGEQMRLGVEHLTPDMRLSAFDHLVKTGIKRFEIGHLGNTGRDGRFYGDQAHAERVIGHIRDMELVDPDYRDIELQFLFGSQTEIIAEALDVLEQWPRERTIIHVYDRLPDGLRNLASKPYSVMDSATRVCRAADIAMSRGFRRFSVSGEGATDCTVEEALDYYCYIAQYLDAWGSTNINVNLANTYGSPPEGEWDYEGLKYFDHEVKSSVDSSEITTSIHVHSDDRSAVEFSTVALKAGFDMVEGTIFGMGERSGNVPLCDVLIRLLEIARIEVEAKNRPLIVRKIGSLSVGSQLFDNRHLPSELIKKLSSWYEASIALASIYGTIDRFHKTSLGDPDAYNAGSGPHDNATEKALSNPARYPLWRNYLRIAIPHVILGRPEANGVIAVDQEVVKSITVNGHAGGGATDRIMSGQVSAIDSRDQAIADARKEIDRILDQATC